MEGGGEAKRSTDAAVHLLCTAEQLGGAPAPVPMEMWRQHGFDGPWTRPNIVLQVRTKTKRPMMTTTKAVGVEAVEQAAPFR